MKRKDIEHLRDELDLARRQLRFVDELLRGVEFQAMPQRDIKPRRLLEAIALRQEVGTVCATIVRAQGLLPPEGGEKP